MKEVKQVEISMAFVTDKRDKEDAKFYTRQTAQKGLPECFLDDFEIKRVMGTTEGCTVKASSYIHMPAEALAIEVVQVGSPEMVELNVEDQEDV